MTGSAPGGRGGGKSTAAVELDGSQGVEWAPPPPPSFCGKRFGEKETRETGVFGF
ncbi:hypothetical protein TRIUR3_04990 [Triticum urartu]|uniref:Uncharacterized protein n=1 Tax=Triticum urartu TaxID=4572 RepID=M7ZTL5_TRIUA|nr:hypothetical protein TRIUR3_04990 [Triticum urartu]